MLSTAHGDHKDEEKAYPMNMLDRPSGVTPDGAVWIPSRGDQAARMGHLMMALVEPPYCWTLAYCGRGLTGPWRRVEALDVGEVTAEFLCGSAEAMFPDYRWGIVEVARLAPGPHGEVQVLLRNGRAKMAVTIEDSGTLPPSGGEA